MLVKKNVNLKCYYQKNETYNCCVQDDKETVYTKNGKESMGMTNVTQKFWNCCEYQKSLLRRKRSNNKLKSYKSSEDSRLWSDNKDDQRRAILEVTKTYVSNLLKFYSYFKL